MHFQCLLNEPPEYTKSFVLEVADTYSNAAVYDSALVYYSMAEKISSDDKVAKSSNFSCIDSC